MSDTKIALRDIDLQDLYNRYWKQLYYFILKIIRDQDEAKDILQEVFLAFIEQGSYQIESEQKVKSYLFSIARYKCFEKIRTSVKYEEISESISNYLVAREYSPFEQVLSKEYQVWLDKEILALPAKMRTVFILSRTEQLSQKEIAERLQISPHTVKRQMSNALQILKRKLYKVVFISVLLSVCYIFS